VNRQQAGFTANLNTKYTGALHHEKKEKRKGGHNNKVYVVVCLLVELVGRDEE